MFQKHDYLNLHFEHKHSIVLQKKALVLQDVVILLKNYPILHVRLLILELQHELNDLSKLMSLRQKVLINDDLNEIQHF
ncbi:hypothetical protein Mapa_017996 [Marchantia paleacea]|nr:hypothetical protein Mapa_018437 [Marchantia paleacea]KAG6540256.1 hypothetical protein Mapa_018382 [Marchantia paleacea]KAG6540664.1 hypothetical protein Mapa_017996 [Marchantia paleacea]